MKRYQYLILSIPLLAILAVHQLKLEENPKHVIELSYFDSSKQSTFTESKITTSYQSDSNRFLSHPTSDPVELNASKLADPNEFISNQEKLLYSEPTPENANMPAQGQHSEQVNLVNIEERCNLDCAKTEQVATKSTGYAADQVNEEDLREAALLSGAINPSLPQPIELKEQSHLSDPPTENYASIIPSTVE